MLITQDKWLMSNSQITNFTRESWTLSMYISVRWSESESDAMFVYTHFCLFGVLCLFVLLLWSPNFVAEPPGLVWGCFLGHEVNERCNINKRNRGSKWNWHRKGREADRRPELNNKNTKKLGMQSLQGTTELAIVTLSVTWEPFWPLLPLSTSCSSNKPSPWSVHTPHS